MERWGEEPSAFDKAMDREADGLELAVVVQTLDEEIQRREADVHV